MAKGDKGITLDSPPLELAILDNDNNIIPVDSALDWHEWSANNQNRINLGNDLVSNHRVHTFFLGANHRFGGLNDLWFKTKVTDMFSKPKWQRMYETYEQAAAGHKEVLELLLTGKQLPPQP